MTGLLWKGEDIATMHRDVLVEIVRQQHRQLQSLGEERNIWNTAVSECAAILDEAESDWRRIRDPGMANNAKSYACKIRALSIVARQGGA